MAFIGIEFSKEEPSDGGGLAVVHIKWLTPKKKECFWPPMKTQRKFDAVLKDGASPEENNWNLHKVERIFFECDDLQKAKQKLKQAESTSDIQSEVEITKKRKRLAPRKLYEDSSSEGEQDSELISLPRISLAKRKAPSSSSFTEINTPSNPSFITNTPSTTSFTRNTPSTSSCSTGKEAISNNSAVLLGTPAIGADITGFQLNLLKTLETIKEQNRQILSILNDSNQSKCSTPRTTLSNLPVELPITNVEHLTLIEEYLEKEENFNNLILYLSCLGGKDLVTQTNHCMRRLLTNKFACSFSFCGTRGEKQAFGKLTLEKCVVGAVQRNLHNIKEKEIEDSIKNWLKHSPQRYRNECNKLQKIANPNGED